MELNTGTPTPEPQAQPSVEAAIERPNSVKVSMNAKGMMSFEVKAYANTIKEAATIALKTATDLEIMLRNKNNLGGV